MHLFLSFLAPLTLPALSRPAGRKRGLTAIFGRVSKQMKYTHRGTLKTKMDFEFWNSFFGFGYFGLHAVEAGLSSAAAGGSGRALFERSEFSPTPPDASSARNREAALTSAVFSFGSLYLDKQRKGTRLPGRYPACREASSHGRMSGAKMKTNKSASKPTTQFDATAVGAKVCGHLRFKPGLLGSEPKFAQPSAVPAGAPLRVAAKLRSDPNNPTTHFDATADGSNGLTCGRPA